MLTLKPAWLVERELTNQLLRVGTQLLALPSSSEVLIRLWDAVGSLSSQVYQDPTKSIQEVFVSMKEILISTMLTNHADLDV